MAAKWLKILVVIVSVVTVSGQNDVCSRQQCKCKTVKASYQVDCTSSQINNLSSVSFPANVTTLILDKNPIKSIPTGIFSGLEALTSLSLQALSVQLELKSGAFSGLGSLTQLILTGTKLKMDDAVFANLTSLTHLDLSATTISSVPNLNENKKLSELILAGNMLEEVKLGPTCCSALKQLTLSNNALKQLDNESWPNMPQLTALKLSHNKISSIDGLAFSKLQVLQSLDLSSNPVNNGVLKNIVQSLSSSIVSLKLANTNITSIENNAFSGLQHLTTLDLSGNNIGILTEDMIGGLDALQHLDVHSTNISQLNGTVFKTKTLLMTLRLQANRLSSIPPGIFDTLQKLELLDLSAQNASLSALPAQLFSKNVKLTTLNLAYNSLGAQVASDVNGTLLAGLGALKELYLASNQISYLPDGFFANAGAGGVSSSADAGFPSLASLYLQDNALKSWPDTLFASLKALKRLNLSANGVELLTNDTVMSLPYSGLELDLAGNPWACNCSLLWFRYWLNESTVMNNISVPGWINFVCGPNSAPPLKGQKLVNFNNRSIVCGPTPPPSVVILAGNGFLYGVIAAAVFALLFAVLLLLWIYRYDLVISVHLRHLRSEVLASEGLSAGNSRESLVRDGGGFMPLERSMSKDVYLIFANDETDRDWVRTSIVSRLKIDSYMVCEYHPHTTLSCVCSWFERLSAIDACANVLIVVSEKLEPHRNSGLLQLDMRYAFDRARKLHKHFRPPIVIQRGAFCSCGARQHLPRHLVAQMHCDTCRLPLEHSSRRAEQVQSGWNTAVPHLSAEVRSCLRWPETSEADSEEFWTSLKLALGPPVLAAEAGMITLQSPRS